MNWHARGIRFWRRHLTRRWSKSNGSSGGPIFTYLGYGPEVKTTGQALDRIFGDTIDRLQRDYWLRGNPHLGPRPEASDGASPDGD